MPAFAAAPARPHNASGTSGTFHGWRMVGYAAVLLALTAPGQTAAVSVFIDPMLAGLGISRSTVSIAYMLGTLSGAVAMPFIGKLVDRHGSRRAITVIAVLLGAVLVAMAAVGEIFGLTAGFIGIRMLGQGALGLAATTIASHWFDRRRGIATGVVSAFGLAGICLAPIGLERLISATNWQTAWLVQGVAVWAIAIPIAVFGLRNRPADVGQFVDGEAPTVDTLRDQGGMTRAEAMRTPYFWVLCAAVGVTALLTTAIAFHQIDLLAARGLSAADAAGNFLPQTVAGTLVALGAGMILDKASPRLLIAVTVGLLAVGMLWAAVVTPGLSAIGFGLVLGAAGYLISPVGDGLAPRLFGVRHIGAIRGTMAAISVASSAFGPLMFTLLHDAGGSYTLPLVVSAALPMAVGVAAYAIRLPEPSRTVPEAQFVGTHGIGTTCCVDGDGEQAVLNLRPVSRTRPVSSRAQTRPWARRMAKSACAHEQRREQPAEV
ncbi:MFS transporter [Phytomonospora endophytica]|uniref:MFS family permease n=2 Tax=Phytomonospora endophytica TaxID=714109 RepID=A0A841FK25_9ACTN|nr:MFS transporter [Phytomonospora endophytica]MBB6032989.1 MFS family permease [Phytomonospora endophytica]